MPIDPELLEILVCPQCKGAVRLDPAGDGLICDRCRLRYRIEDDIPQMLVEEAEPLDARG
ncbi:MAG TPA: Trm112 family protein [Thermodesulfobacteriota bacterium]|nr:Trm112 family protein [Thermodesulfobacteriota bacterium]